MALSILFRIGQEHRAAHFPFPSDTKYSGSLRMLQNRDEVEMMRGGLYNARPAGVLPLHPPWCG